MADVSVFVYLPQPLVGGSVFFELNNRRPINTIYRTKSGSVGSDQSDKSDESDKSDKSNWSETF